MTLGLLAAAGSCSTPPAPPAAVRIRWAQDPENLDPMVLPNPQAIEAANLLHCSLLQLDYAQQLFQPALAVRLPAQRLLGDSLTVLTYELRPEARWDDGKPVTARDVAFSLKLMACPPALGLPNEDTRMAYRFIREVRQEAATPRRVSLVCAGQAPTHLQATGTFPILPEHRLDAAGRLRRFSLATLQNWPATQPPDTGLTAFAHRYRSFRARQQGNNLPGCGPYLLAGWTRDAQLTFRRKPAWWADQLPAPTPAVLQARSPLLKFEIIPDEATAGLALQRGELDLFPQVPARLFAQLRQSPTARQKLAFYTASSFEVVTVAFNTQRPGLADAPTRQALSLLLDASGLLQATQLGGGQRTVGLISPADPRGGYCDSLPLLAFDPPRAAVLLGQAGWRRHPDGWHRLEGAAAPAPLLQLRLRYRTGDAMQEIIALQFRAAAARIGVPVALRPTEAGALGAALKEGDFDLCVRTIKGNPFSCNFTPLLHSRAIGEGNVSRFGTAASDQLIEQLAAAAPPAQQVRLLRRFQVMVREQAPLVPLFVVPTRLAATRQLAGLRAYGLKPGYAVTALHRVAATDPAAVTAR